MSDQSTVLVVCFSCCLRSAVHSQGLTVWASSDITKGYYNSVGFSLRRSVSSFCCTACSAVHSRFTPLPSLLPPSKFVKMGSGQRSISDHHYRSPDTSQCI
ncbi:hypothetical protein F5J12DRAFT_276667 [Pisolithus orientalis]|uniref:uncharacterized protein n=1 Tax=Pisolithus orientalis TaxID=936130 RepID=UPI002224AF40|nr:uncharacterized protein F5J12DRAFT_276667 [Pisolithus orientalis]KAI5999376.1 hypothetical protein F5J12DRAFT_276667 [Pisolithus orientalis]